MSTNAATKLPVVWPGTSSQLTSGAGGAVTVGSGLSLSGGTLATAGSRLALDANHILAYYCDETSGTTLANSVSGNAYPLTLAGTYRLGDKGLFSHGTGAVRFAGVSSTHGASNNSVSTAAFSSAFTVEAVCSWDPNYPDANGPVLVAMATASNTNQFFIYRVPATGNLRANLQIGASAWTADLAVPSYVNRMHVAATWASGSPLTLWVNGSSSAASANVTGTWGTATSVAIGVQFGAIGNAWRGLIAEARWSNSVRAQSYLLDAAQAAGAL